MIIFSKSAIEPNIIVEMSNERRYFDDDSYSPWSIDEITPNNIVKGFSSLFIKEGYRLIAYLYSGSMGGNGFVYAIPENDRPLPLPKTAMDYDLFENRSRPENALLSFMEAIDGDKSPLSYLQAAILYHELCELGASWHGVSWGMNSILPIDSPNDSQEKYKWEMCREEPEVINPHFYYDKFQNPVIVFYTIDIVFTVTLNEYKHIFNKDNYTLKINRDVIGTAGAGIIF